MRRKFFRTLPSVGGGIDYSFHPRPALSQAGASMGIQHARKELGTANKRRRKQRKNKLRSTKKYKK